MSIIGKPNIVRIPLILEGIFLNPVEIWFKMTKKRNAVIWQMAQ
jgi:hypothetical protein